MAKTTSVQESNVVGSKVIIRYPAIGKEVSLDYDKLSPEMQRAAGLHGLKQKLGDAKSGGTASEKYEMASRIAESIEKGAWELSRGVGDGGLSAFVEALAEFTGKTVEYAAAAVAKADDEMVASWRKHPKVVAIMKRIAAERAAAAAEKAEEIEINL